MLRAYDLARYPDELPGKNFSQTVFNDPGILSVESPCIHTQPKNQWVVIFPQKSSLPMVHYVLIAMASVSWVTGSKHGSHLGEFPHGIDGLVVQAKLGCNSIRLS